jgi:hypothetical protein
MSKSRSKHQGYTLCLNSKARKNACYTTQKCDLTGIANPEKYNKTGKINQRYKDKKES